VNDADPGDKSPKKPDDAPQTADALALAEQAEAEAAEAEAVAAAARARALAIRLRQEAEAAEPATDVDTATTEPEATGTEVESTPDDGDTIDFEDADATEEPEKKRRRLRVSWKLAAAALVLLCTFAFIGASVFMFLQHRNAVDEHRRTAEYAAAARQGVVTLMSLDFNKADQDVQRIIDNTTGDFREEFEAQSQAFAQVARDSKVITEVTVNVTAVESMTQDKAVVLVSATSHVSNTAGARNEPRSWRLAVDLAREGDQIKMSKVEFVP
jgi:Mce-associated membrane protein